MSGKVPTPADASSSPTGAWQAATRAALAS